jgi:hypothetical protein
MVIEVVFTFVGIGMAMTGLVVPMKGWKRDDVDVSIRLPCRVCNKLAFMVKVTGVRKLLMYDSIHEFAKPRLGLSGD